MRRRSILIGSTGIAAGVWAQSPSATPATTLTISSNNTPMDRAALQALAREAFGRMGLGVRFVNLPSERSLVTANAGEVDGEGLRVAGLDARYPQLMRVPERFINIQFVAFARDRRIDLSHGWTDLQAYRVAHIKGWKLFEQHATRARVAHTVDQAEQLFRMLAAGRVDLALYTHTDGQALIRQLGLSDVFELSPALANADMYLYLHQRHAALVPQLAQALRTMKSDGTHARILGSLTPADPL